MKRLIANINNIYNDKTLWFRFLSNAVKLNNDFSINKIDIEEIQKLLPNANSNIIEEVKIKLQSCLQDDYQKEIIRQNRTTLKIDTKSIIKFGFLHFANVKIAYKLSNEIESYSFIPETIYKDFNMTFVLGNNKISFAICDENPFFEPTYLYNQITRFLDHYVNNYSNNIVYEYGKKFIKDNHETDFVIENTTECLNLKDKINDTILSFTNTDYNNRENIFVIMNNKLYFGNNEDTHGQLISRVLNKQIHDGVNRPKNNDLETQNIISCVFGHYNNQCAFIDAWQGSLDKTIIIDLLKNNKSPIVKKIYLSDDNERFTRQWLRLANKNMFSSYL